MPAAQPANTTISVFRRVRVFRDNRRHTSIKHLTTPFDSQLVAVPGEENEVIETRRHLPVRCLPLRASCHGAATDSNDSCYGFGRCSRHQAVDTARQPARSPDREYRWQPDRRALPVGRRSCCWRLPRLISVICSWGTRHKPRTPLSDGGVMCLSSLIYQVLRREAFCLISTFHLQTS